MKRVVSLLLKVVLGAAVVLLTLAVVERQSGKRRLARTLEAIESAGETLRISELRPPTIPEQSNAWSALLPHTNRLATVPDSLREPPSLWNWAGARQTFASGIINQWNCWLGLPFAIRDSSLAALILFLLALPAATPAQPLDPNRPPLRRGELTSYSWIESNDIVRVPKGLVRYLDFPALNIPDDPEHLRWTVSDVFSGVFGLTTAEIEALTILINQAKRAERRAEGNSLKPVEGQSPMGAYRSPAGLKVLDERTFLLEPPPAALAGIETNLREGLLRLLGKQRSEELWRRSTFQQSLHPAPTGSESFTFRLIEFRGTRSVDIVKVSGGGSSGGPLFEEADQYAPESLKPILQRWRAAIHDYRRTKPVVAGVGPAAPAIRKAATMVSPDANAQSSQSAGSQVTSTNSAWPEGSAYAEFSKSFIPALGIPKISDAGVSPEAEVLFGLTPDEVKRVSGLFNEFRNRFELLEASHFTRQNAGENRFVLSKFPDEAQSLSDEWGLRLQGIVGERRGELLNLSTMAAETDIRRMLFDGRTGRQPSVAGWPVWLLRGKKAFQITASFQKGANGTFSLELKDLEDPSGLKAWLGGPIQNFPKEFRHLFLLEGLEQNRAPDPSPF